MSYDFYWVKNRAEKIADFEHPSFRDKIKRKNPKERLPCKPFLGMNEK